MMPQVNLLLDIPKAPKQWLTSRHVVWIAGAFLGWLVLVNIYGNIQRRAAGNELLALKKEQQAISEKMVALGASAGSGKLDQKQLKESIDNLVLELKQRSALKAHLDKFDANNVVGFSPFMVGLGKSIVPGVWLNQFTVYNGGTDLSIKGKALESTLVTEYLERLIKETPELKGKKFKVVEISSQEDKKTGETKSEIEFEARTSEDTYAK